MKDALLDQGIARSFTAGEFIYRYGDSLRNPAIFYIQKGEVELIKEYPHNGTSAATDTLPEKEVFLCKQDDLFGMFEVYPGISRITSAQAVSDVELLELTRIEFERIMIADMDLALKVFDIYSQMLHQVQQRFKPLVPTDG